MSEVKRLQHPNSRANLKPNRGGEIRNPQGINGWTKMREKARISIESDQEALVDVLKRLALDGDVQALRLALGPLLNQSKLELGGSEDGEITFRWAQPAEQEKETG